MNEYVLRLNADEARWLVALFRFYIAMTKGTPTPLEIATGLMVVRSLTGKVRPLELAIKVRDIQQELERHGEG